MEVIKRIISRKQFKTYNIPDSFGEKAEIIILPYTTEKEANEINSYDLAKLQAENGSANMLNEPEEDAWNDL